MRSFAGTSAAAGSSPLARGLRHRRALHLGRIRIIPARAGFTRRPCGSEAAATDHPRSRGVYSSKCGAPPNRPGSSPLARGLPPPPPQMRSAARIIPARAGFTSPRSTTWTAGRDHPRSRGVYDRGQGRQGLSRGSSPLARGLQKPGQCARPARRIIPARAGFTILAEDDLYAPKDHPRSRGVYRFASTFLPVLPLDHPRSRGVYYGTGIFDLTARGSSPLARGLQDERPDLVEAAGIIPARAGFTPGLRVGGRRVRDHPRSRGVYARRTGRTT